MTRATIDNMMRSFYPMPQYIGPSAVSPEEMGLVGEAARVARPIPAGYHWSGRYMPLQGGSNTRRKATLVQDINESTGEWYVRVFYLEPLSDYFNRISQ